MESFDASSEEQRVEIALLSDIYGSLLTEKQRKTLEMYFQDDLSLSEISDINGISRQGVRDSIRLGVASLYKYEEKLGFLKRITAVNSIFEKALKENISADLKSEINKEMMPK